MADDGLGGCRGVMAGIVLSVATWVVILLIARLLMEALK